MQLRLFPWDLWGLGVFLFLLPLRSNLTFDDGFLMFTIFSVCFYLFNFIVRRPLARNVLLLSMMLVFGFAVHTLLLSGTGLLTPLTWAFLFVSLLLPIFYSVITAYRAVAVGVFLGVLLLHTQWGIAQFIVESDLGLAWLGESRLVVGNSGVATFSSGGVKLLRAYGPYGHPNMLGGASLIGCLLLTPLLLKFWSLPRQQLIFLLCAVATLLLALLLSFSRTAWLGALVWTLTVAFFFFQGRFSERPRPPTLFRYFLLPLLIIVMTLSPLMFQRSLDPGSESSVERIRGVSYALTIIGDQSSGFGFGVGSYPAVLSAFLSKNNIQVPLWEVTSVHSVPLLVLLELGYLGWAGLCTLFFFSFRRLGLILWPFVPALLLDHYFYTDVSMLVWFLIFFIYVRSIAFNKSVFFSE